MHTSRFARLWVSRTWRPSLGVPVKTVYEWRRSGYGPKGRRVGKYVRYDPAAVRQWFDGLSDEVA